MLSLRSLLVLKTCLYPKPAVQFAIPEIAELVIGYLVILVVGILPT